MTSRAAPARTDWSASGRGQVAPFQVMRILELAARRRASGRPVYDLSAGQPSTPAPAAVRAAARAALDADRIAYTPALGLAPLRAAIAQHYRAWYGLDVDSASVAVTTGSSGGFLLALLAAFDAGDTVVVTRPGYPAYRNLLDVLGCRVVEIECGAEANFRLTVEALEALGEAPSGLIIGSPANPTGSMIEATQFARIVDWCAANGVRLLSDEIYHGIAFDQRASCAWEVDRDRHSIVIGSFSKYFSMTGWRLGWLLLPDELIDSVDRLAGNFALCPPTLSQLAAVGAFDAYAELDANVAHYAVNRRLMTSRLPEIGIAQMAPVDGAFYVYADVSRWTSDSLLLAPQLLAETGVALTTGVDFDPVDGGRFIRMCFAGDHDEIATALSLLGDWLAAQQAVDPH
jgi:aspartate/methionine/tyrosine aminotransferase